MAVFLDEFFLRQSETCGNEVDMRAVSSRHSYICGSTFPVGCREAGSCMISHSFLSCSPTDRVVFSGGNYSRIIPTNTRLDHIHIGVGCS